MRTNVNLADDAHQFVSNYAAGRGMSLSAALTEMVRKVQVIETREPEAPMFRRSPAGIPLFSPGPKGRIITAKMVQDSEDNDIE